jgi:hypothetical protein
MAKAFIKRNSIFFRKIELSATRGLGQASHRRKYRILQKSYFLFNEGSTKMLAAPEITNDL